MQTIHIFQIPYDSSRGDWRMGNGPGHFLRHGLEAVLRARGYAVEASRIESADPFPSEIKTAFELYRSLAELVRLSLQAGAFPVVLSGNCSAALGALAGVPDEPLGVVWLDAHGDFNTPETTRSGYLDGMGLAVAAGLCWKNLATSIPYFRPVLGRHILHLGSSDIERSEADLLKEAQVGVISAANIQELGVEAALTPYLQALQKEVASVYIHLDLDVLEPVQWPANHFSAAAGAGTGLDLQEVKEALHLVQERFTVCGLGVASYDPAYDKQGNTLRAGIELIEAVIST